MIKRGVLVLLLLVIIIPISYGANECPMCDTGYCNDICETGEPRGYCADCATTPSCGDGLCDHQDGENDVDGGNYCVGDCGAENGESCSGDAECVSGFCNACGKCGEAVASW